jgi:lysophospholipase L1-like esterase
MHSTLRSSACWRMTGLVCGIAAVLFLTRLAPAVADGLERLTQKLERGEPVRLAATGDSITFVCFHTDFKRNYLTFTADALRHAYPRAKIELTIAGNLGVTGTGLPKLVEKVLKDKPDLVFVMFGMNDCADGPGGLDRYDANLTKFIHQIREASVEPVILTQNEVVEDSLDGGRRLSLPLYMKRAVEVARREKAMCVDLFAKWQRLKEEKPGQWKQYLNDAIHPNLAGHRFFAAEILKQLWSAADRFQSTDVRQPLPNDKRKMTPCLLAGPSQRQLLRIDPITWVALTVGRRGDAPTDLLLWVSHGKREPQQADFQPVNLVGPGSEPVFASHETPINSGLLLPGKDGRLHILFTQTVGVYALTIDTTRPNWWQKLTDRSSYVTLQPGSLPLPECLRGSYQADCELIDACLDADGRPQYLLRDLMIDGQTGAAVGTGIVLERYSSQRLEYVRKMVLPGCRTVRSVVSDDGSWCLVGQDERPDQKGLIFATQKPHGR